MGSSGVKEGWESLYTCMKLSKNKQKISSNKENGKQTLYESSIFTNRAVVEGKERHWKGGEKGERKEHGRKGERREWGQGNKFSSDYMK